MDGMLQTYLVAEGGDRVDRFLVERVGDVSRAHLQRLIAEGRVLVNREEAKASRRLAAGDVVTLDMPQPVLPVLRAEAIPVPILYEDADVVVVDKPAGMVVHPGHGVTSGTLVHALLAHCPSMSVFEDSLRPGIVHRLDKDTSGVMIVAKTPAAQHWLAAQFAARTVQKSYLALVHGRLRAERGIIEAGIGRSRSVPTRMQVAGKASRAARTAYRVVRRYPGYTLVAAQPITGRTHQIRVHFAALGHPLAGDATYGRTTGSLGLRRQFLHAQSLTITLPSGAEPREFAAEPPDDLRRVLDHLASQESP